MWVSKGKKPKKQKKCTQKILCKNPYLFFLALLMCSEFGDKSQISALALSTTQNISSVILGGCAAQISCIVIALIVG
jgi:putative Ca2+/H+ antiporter (TMEM165/GDT1 family)